VPTIDVLAGAAWALVSVPKLAPVPICSKVGVQVMTKDVELTVQPPLNFGAICFGVVRSPLKKVVLPVSLNIKSVAGPAAGGALVEEVAPPLVLSELAAGAAAGLDAPDADPAAANEPEELSISTQPNQAANFFPMEGT
jgi:hypothetical protein